MADASACPLCFARLSGVRCAACGAAARAGAYRVLGVLAQTPHGRTYRAEGPTGLVALKELVFALVPSAEQLDAFEREAKLLGSVSHPQVPRLIESFREGEGTSLRLYIAQELLDGEPLSERMQSHVIDEVEGRAIARQVLEILGYLHHRGIVHRDVKPANILRRSEGTLALVDFGAARALEGVTHGATLVGTFGYMPPEQLGGTVDATSDLYALGATLVHLIGRKAPADIFGPSLELRLDHLNVSRSFRAFLAYLTARARRSRPRSAAEALRALDSAPSLRRPLRTTALAAAIALFLVTVAFGLRLAVSWLEQGLARPSEAARRARLEALNRELAAPPQIAASPATGLKASGPSSDGSDYRDISIGRLLNGEKLRQLDPELPSCYRSAGVELARVRVWPVPNHLQVKMVLHSQNPQCDWLPLEVTVRTLGGAALRRLSSQGDTPRDGWREILYNFALPAREPAALDQAERNASTSQPETERKALAIAAVRLELAGPSRPLEAWRLDLDRGEVRRVGYALAGRIEAPEARIQIPLPTGCAHLERGALDKLWIEQPAAGQKQLVLHGLYSKRKDSTEHCRPGAQLALLEPTSKEVARARLEPDGQVSFTLPLPESRDRLRVALRAPTGVAAVLRLDLLRATAEAEAFAAVAP